MGLTDRSKRYGIIVRQDGTKIVLEEPRKAGYISEPGGVFFKVEHKTGHHMILASQVWEYSEIQTQPNDSGSVVVTQPGAY